MMLVFRHRQDPAKAKSGKKKDDQIKNEVRKNEKNNFFIVILQSVRKEIPLGQNQDQYLFFYNLQKSVVVFPL